MFVAAVVLGPKEELTTELLAAFVGREQARWCRAETLCSRWWSPRRRQSSPSSALSDSLRP